MINTDCLALILVIFLASKLSSIVFTMLGNASKIRSQESCLKYSKRQLKLLKKDFVTEVDIKFEG